MAEQVTEAVERLYVLAKQGAWSAVLSAFDTQPLVAANCSRFKKASSGWTFLHQAAYFGSESAARALIRLGASLKVQSNERETAADVADARGHGELSRLLRTAAQSADNLWEPSSHPELLPSSCAWVDGVVRRASNELRVSYGGGAIVIPAGSRYFVDSFERILVGWHGTYDPPCGMDAESMV